MKLRRAVSSGYQIIQIMGLVLLSLMVSAFAIDFSYYYAAQNTLQTAADSAALAATTELYHSTQSDIELKLDDAWNQAQDMAAANQSSLVLDSDDVIFGFVDPATKVYDPATFRTPTTDPDYSTTGGYNAVRVKIRRGAGSSNSALNTIMGNMLGIRSMNTEANAVGLIDQTVNEITDGGLRPIYACEAQFNRAMSDGNLEGHTVRIYGDHVEIDGVQNISGCPAMGSGNWGFADFTDCSSGTVGASTIRDWFANGYPGTVTSGQCYSTKPGNFISSISGELDTLIANQTVFPIPLYNSWSGNGSNGQVNVSGFAGFKITSYEAQGAQSGRYIEGHFYRYACNTGCSSGSDGSTTPGGAVVKLRLASKS
jgi:Flp pilus assembly protein TadG